MEGGNKMDIKTFQELSKRTMPKIGTTENIDGDNTVLSRAMIAANYALGLSGEAGETSDYIKKVIFHGHPFDRDKLVKELGDIMHYASGVATLFNIDMEEVLDKNIEKLQKRYPNGFTQEDSIKRVDCD